MAVTCLPQQRLRVFGAVAVPYTGDHSALTHRAPRFLWLYLSPRMPTNTVLSNNIYLRHFSLPIYGMHVLYLPTYLLLFSLTTLYYLPTILSPLILSHHPSLPLPLYSFLPPCTFPTPPHPSCLLPFPTTPGPLPLLFFSPQSDPVSWSS